MKEIPVTTLVPLSYFDKPVYLDSGYILLTADSPVTEEMVKRLKKWKYAQVLTEGGTKAAPSYLTGTVSSSVASQTIDENIQDTQRASEARAFYADYMAFARSLFEEFVADNALDLAHASEWVKKMIQIVHDHRDYLLRYLDLIADVDRTLITHSVNSSILAVCLGDFLKAPPHRLIELGIACLLHEIGMFKLPENLRRSNKAYTLEERKAMQAHTALAYRIFKSFSVPENIALAALEHHERVDGSGYPRSLTGEKITEYARIIAVACSYDAMISRRSFRLQPMDRHAALKALLQNRKQYDDRVLKALVYTLSVYPVGTPVMLSNKSKGYVARTDPAKPRCPIVKVILDPEGKRLSEAPLVQTTEGEGLHIGRVLGPDEAKSVGNPA